MSKTFRGGSYPPQRKTLAVNMSIENHFLHQIRHIPMNKQIGVQAIPVFKTVDIIDEG